MAEYLNEELFISIYINPDGTWTDSAFKAHYDGVEYFVSDSYPGYLLSQRPDSNRKSFRAFLRFAHANKVRN